MGAVVRVNSLTNYDPLGTVIRKYNLAVADPCPQNRVDNEVVGLRDMIAHGRLLMKSPSPPFTLHKFGQEKPDGVRVVAKETMDAAWFGAKLRFVYEQIAKVEKAAALMGFRTISPE